MLQLVGASLSLAGSPPAGGRSRTIVPYVNAPEEIVPGVPLRYATTMPFGVNAPRARGREPRRAADQDRGKRAASRRRSARRAPGSRPRSTSSTIPTARVRSSTRTTNHDLGEVPRLVEGPARRPRDEPRGEPGGRARALLLADRKRGWSTSSSGRSRAREWSPTPRSATRTSTRASRRRAAPSTSPFITSTRRA